MDGLTVKELARLAGVSVRTLHHYDKTGLLKPAGRTDSQYRLYGQKELFRLQQVLLYKELDFPPSEIKEILDNPGFDLVAALKNHRQELEKRKERTRQLIETVELTIDQLNIKNKKMDYKEMYKGFSKAEEYEKEAKQRWGEEMVEESKNRVLQMKQGDWEDLKQEGIRINEALVKLMHLSPSDKKVQDLVKRHFDMIGNFYTVTPEIYRGLAEMYLADERFKEYYEKHQTGLADFLSRAMLVFAEKL